MVGPGYGLAGGLGWEGSIRSAVVWRVESHWGEEPAKTQDRSHTQDN